MASPHDGPEKGPKYSRRVLVFVCFLSLVGVLPLGFVLGRIGTRPATLSSNFLLTNAARQLKPGPWGTIDYVPMTIAAPAEILPVRGMEADTTHWLFKGFSRDDLAKVFDSLDISAADREQLLSPPALQEVAGGLDLTPPRGAFLSLSPKARLKLYSTVAQFPENDSQLVFLHSTSLAEHFQQAGVSSETIAIFNKLSCRHGEYFILAGLPYVLSEIADYGEKTRFVKALTCQDTLLLRLYVTPDSDIDELASYWGRACWSTDVKAMLDSLAHVPGGTWVNLAILMPPFPSSHLYDFPLPDNPESGPPVRHDCHWTSFNFFKDPPDPKSVDDAYLAERLKLDYFPVASDPRYGDLVLLVVPEGGLIHSAVFLADDVVFTKNGDTLLHPWMLSTIADLLKQYSFHVPAGQKLIVKYFRNKYS